jgi:hypothetical protein
LVIDRPEWHHLVLVGKFFDPNPFQVALTVSLPLNPESKTAFQKKRNHLPHYAIDQQPLTCVKHIQHFFARRFGEFKIENDLLSVGALQHRSPEAIFELGVMLIQPAAAIRIENMEEKKSSLRMVFILVMINFGPGVRYQVSGIRYQVRKSLRINKKNCGHVLCAVTVPIKCHL